MNTRFTPRAGPPFGDSEALWYRVTGAPFQGDLSVRLGRGTNGRYVCTALAVDSADKELRTGDLRKIPLGAIVDLIVSSAAEVDPKEDVAFMHLEGADLNASGGFVLIDPTPSVEVSQRGLAGADLDGLRRFAVAYLTALNGPDRRRPIYAVARALSISESTAHRYRGRCQAEGLLEKQE